MIAFIHAFQGLFFVKVIFLFSNQMVVFVENSSAIGEKDPFSISSLPPPVSLFRHKKSDCQHLGGYPSRMHSTSLAISFNVNECRAHFYMVVTCYLINHLLMST